MARNLNSVSALAKSGGYLSFNSSSDRFEIKHNHFGGRLVAWIHYKFSQNYKNAVDLAQTKLNRMMNANTVYKRNFGQRTAERTPPGFLRESSPISARQVHLFIKELETERYKTRYPILPSRRQRLESSKKS